MNVITLIFLIANSIGVLALPRKWAPIPLLASCCYMTTGQVLEVGPISLTVYRIVLAAGLLRVFVRRESVAGGINTIDKLMIAWGGWLIFASFFHEWMKGSGPIYASGFVFNIAAVYLLVRVWCRDVSDLSTTLRIVAWMLVPVALAMIAEHLLHKNAFAVLGGVPPDVPIRDGKIRAQGPFAHPILAGTAGAVTIPLMIGIWRNYRTSSIVGSLASVAMVLASTSSTPLMSMLLGVGATVMWRFRGAVRAARWAAIGLYLVAGIFMTRPAYYLMSKVDFTGSSTGWYRSRLIQSAFEHISDWWLFGTDNTGSWMYPAIDEKHSDITNYYLYFGTTGGLPAMLLLIAILWCGFIWVGRAVRDTSPVPNEHRFMVWCLGAGLCSHAASSLAVAYFDQSVTFFWLNVAAISAVYSGLKVGTTPKRPVPVTARQAAATAGRRPPRRARLMR